MRFRCSSPLVALALASAAACSSSASDGPPAPRLVSDLTVTDVAIFQTVKITLAKDGAPVSHANAPVIAGRDAVVRVYVAPTAAYAPRPITAELLLSDGPAAPTVVSDTRTIAAPSSDAAPETMFAFSIAAASLTPTTRFSVRLTAANGTPAVANAPVAARFPRDGTAAPLGAQSDAGGLHVTLVPVRWTGDGSNRLPDTSTAQLDRYRAVMTAAYPIAHLELALHAAIDFGQLTPKGNVDFSGLNQALTVLRAGDAPASDVYYYALVNAADSFDAYCSSSCVTGQSFVVDNATDAALRVGGGVGFTGDSSAWTMAHELGHEHGRTHAPCGVSSSDPGYPYTNATVGVWGWDARTATFLAPDATKDFMSYCDPAWVSDYTYAALFDRATAVRPVAKSVRSASSSMRSYRFLRLGARGEAAWGATITLENELSATPGEAAIRADDGHLLATIAVPTVALSHDADRFALVPLPLPVEARWIDLGAAHARIDAP